MKRLAEVYFEVDGLYIKCGFNPAFPPWLKEEVPPSMRKWDSEKKWWHVHPNFGEKVYESLGTFFNVIEYDDRTFEDKKNRWDTRRARKEFERQQQNRKQEWEATGGPQRDRTRQKFEDFFNGKKEEERRRSQPPPTRPRKMDMLEAMRVLGLSGSFTPEQAKKAYRQMAVRYHPDRNPGNAEAEDMMKRVNEAWAVVGGKR